VSPPPITTTNPSAKQSETKNRLTATIKPTIVFFILFLLIVEVAGLIAPLLSQYFISQKVWGLSRMKIEEPPKETTIPLEAS
jgi:hypothetical protein